MPKTIHDTLVYRLAHILTKLNQGEKLDPRVLADEFGVNMRTIQRDLNERFTYLPIEKTDGKYHLNQHYLGKINFNDIKQFVNIAGVKGLFPSFSHDSLQEILTYSDKDALFVKGHDYEDIGDKYELFNTLEKSIVNHKIITFNYKKNQLKNYHDVSPYKLINDKGIWYLIAIHNNQIKTFSFTKITNLTTTDYTFNWDKNVASRIFSADSIWSSETQEEVLIQINATVADYFKRRKLIANQVIEKELENGDLIISVKIGHSNQILPIVRYWIPNLKIIQPRSLQIEIECGLRAYLDVLTNKGSAHNNN